MKNKKLVIKVIALIIGGLAILFFGMSIIVDGIPDIFGSENTQFKSMVLLMGFAIAGYIFSFFRQKEGGLVMIFSGILLGLNMFYHGGVGDAKAGLIFALPFLIPGVMLWWVGRSE